MPSVERKKEIETTVDGIIKKNNIDRPGFDLTAFLTQCESFKVGLQKLDDDTTGLLLVNENQFVENTQTHRLIVINNNLKDDPNFPKRRRFITAHEYGHYILHKNGEVIFAHRDYTTRGTPQEKEADYFARCLLMPRDLVNETLSIGGVKSASIKEQVSLIARTFNVTEKKARQRLVEDLVCG